MMKPHTLEELSLDGFGLPSTMRTLKGYALLSLRIALESYFSTYKSMKYFLHIFEGASTSSDIMHSTEYCSRFGQVIIHFQHFAELVCKDILRHEHELLVIKAESKPQILWSLLKGKEIEQSDYEKLHAIEFSTALDRVLKLLDCKILDMRYAFIKQAKLLLETLNGLRNRLLHRGTFVLRYPALDELVGLHILPFALQVCALPEYQEQTSFWKYQSPKCGVDPIAVIVSDWANKKYEIGKIALLKEIGRAAYNNPVHDEPFAIFGHEEQQRAELGAASVIKSRQGSNVGECPVCGARSLIQYDDREVDFDEDPPVVGDDYPYMHLCLCCSFEVNYHLKNPSEYGLSMNKFW